MAARVAQRQGMPVSPATISRLVRRTSLAERATPSLLGVDEWAYRRRLDFKTILVVSSDQDAHGNSVKLTEEAVIGPSGAGKTTRTTAVLGDRPGQIVVLTAKEGDHWGGLQYTGIDEDATYATANETFNALEAEVKRRLVAVKQKRMTADWLTIVVDDFSTLQKECPVASDVVKLVARLGRSLRVRLVMLSDSALVKAVGLEGEGETRSNFAFIRLQRGHKGTIEVEGRELPIDTSMVHQLSGRANLAPRVWRQPRDEASEMADLLGLSEPVGAISGGFRPDRPDQTVQTEPSDRTLVRILHATGVSREKAREALKAEGMGLDNNYWAELNKA